MKFTLRELFLLVLVVALALGWWLDRSNLLKFKHEYLHYNYKHQVNVLLRSIERREEEIRQEKSDPPIPPPPLTEQFE